MSRRFRGNEYVTVERPTVQRTRHGDVTSFKTYKIGPCSIAWSTAWSRVAEVKSLQLDSTSLDVSLFFDHEPDVDFDDRIVIDSRKTKYRVVAVEPWKRRSNGALMGTEVRISGLETGGNNV